MGDGYTFLRLRDEKGQGTAMNGEWVADTAETDIKGMRKRERRESLQYR